MDGKPREAAPMTALSTKALLHRLNTETNPDKRLYLAPILEPEQQCKNGQAAIDVRLGFDFCLVTASSFGVIDEFSRHGHSPDALRKLYKRQYVALGQSIIIHPHQFMLAQTLEYMRLPPDLMAYVVGRSTWGRLGLIVATAVGIHPNFAGSLTLELRNLGETPIVLYPGQTIAQLFFHPVSDTDGTAARDKAPGAQYAGTVDMVPKRMSDDNTRLVIQKLIDKA